MALTDDELLAFDSSDYADYDEAKARELLAGEYGDAYRAQLVAAHLIDRWREATVDHDHTVEQTTFSTDYTTAWAKAAGDIVAFLRQGDCIPSGALYRNT